MHLISVHLSSLTIFLFFFFTRYFVVLPFISLYTLLKLTEEERAKAMSRKEIENCVVELKTMKISSSLHRIMVCDFLLFIYLFEIMKQIVFIFCLSFLFFENTFLGNTIFFALLSVYHSCLWYVLD